MFEIGFGHENDTFGPESNPNSVLLSPKGFSLLNISVAAAAVVVVVVVVVVVKLLCEVVVVVVVVIGLR